MCMCARERQKEPKREKRVYDACIAYQNEYQYLQLLSPSYSSNLHSYDDNAYTEVDDLM